ncbi:MAG: aldose 1-epimerase [Firmicutes bacterium]|nr:aldose 1-epimerase [Bacillota bacterium]
MEFGSKQVIVLEAGGYTAWAVPEAGGQLIGLSKGGIKALAEPASWEDFQKGTTSYGLPILFPPNRIDGGRFEVDGKVYQFPLNEPKRFNSLHGFLHKRPWEVVESRSDYLKMRFVGDDTTDFFEHFPAYFEAIQEYKLDETGLSQTVTIINTGEDLLPVGLGFHSAFAVDEDSRILLSVGKRIEVDDRMLPTDVVRELNEEESKLREGGLDPMTWSMDDHYTAEDLEINGVSFHGGVIYRKGAVVTYEVDPFYRHWMVWNCKQKGGFVCLEPQNWRINAPNLAASIGPDSGFDLLPAEESLSVDAHISIDLT